MDIALHRQDDELHLMQRADKEMQSEIAQLQAGE